MESSAQAIGKCELGGEITSARFEQFEECSAAFRHAGWGAEYVQLEPGRFRGRLRLAEFESLQIADCVWERRLRHLGAPPRGTILLGVTISQQSAEGSQQGAGGRYLGRPFGLDDVIIVPDGTELHFVSATTWRATGLVIPEDEFLDRLVPLIRDDSLGGPGLARLARPQAARLRRACEDFYRATERLERSFDEEFPLRSMAVDLADFAIGLIAEARIDSVPMPDHRRRAEIFRKAEEYVRSSIADVPRIPDLCRAIGTSERSLRYAFETVAGVSPSAYLKANRLSRVHEALLERDPRETLVKSVAYQYGFWHLGQFSKDYREIFGEPPSATLSRESHGTGLRTVS